MKDSHTKFSEIMVTLETQMKFLEDVRKVRIKNKNKKSRINWRPVTLRVRNVNNVDDFLKWYGTRDWPLILEEKFKLQTVITEEGLKEILKSAVPDFNDQFKSIKEKIDAIEEDVDDFLYFLRESVPKKVSITNIVNNAHTNQVKGAEMKKGIIRDEQKFSVQDINKISTNATLDFVGLIGSLDTMTILKKVFDSLHMKNKTRAVFETIFLSENTKVLIESIFWWIYLDLLEPSMQQYKELLFSRMAEKYVALLMSIPAGFNDVILDEIPKALSQATYVAFFDGLRTQHQCLDDNFKQYILFYITKWTTGITPQREAGNKEREKMAELTGERTETIAEMLTHSILSNTPVKADLTLQDLEDQQKHQENKFTNKVSAMKEVPKLSKEVPKLKENYEPEMNFDSLQLEKVKFNLYSQCPLVNYCMNSKKMSAIYMVPPNQVIQRLQRTEKTPKKTFFNSLKP